MGSHCFVALALWGLVALLGVRAQDGWEIAHATFYGDTSAGEAKQGACGYEDTLHEGYGTNTAALSTVLFDDGKKCGSCYQLRCFNTTHWCRRGIITVTGTNFCPPNWQLPSGQGGWCNPPRPHFDLTLPAFLKIGVYKAGIVPVKYRRVPCARIGGIKFRIRTDSKLPWWLAVEIYNIAGVGDIKEVSIKGSKTNWISMTRNWGVVWQTSAGLVGQSLSFRVTTSDGKMAESIDVAPPNWTLGQVFEGKQISG